MAVRVGSGEIGGGDGIGSFGEIGAGDGDYFTSSHYAKLLF